VDTDALRYSSPSPGANDRPAALLRGVNGPFDDEADGELGASPWPGDTMEDLFRRARGTAARRRHGSVGTGHIALALLDDPHVAGALLDPEITRAGIESFLDELSAVLPPAAHQ
jgi:hypothetical protein